MNENLVIGKEVWFFICFHDDSSLAVHLEDFYLSKGKITSIRTSVNESTEYTIHDDDEADLVYRGHETEIYTSYQEAIEHIMERVQR